MVYEMTSCEEKWNEKEWIMLARQGYEEAMTRILNHHKPFLFRLAQRFWVSYSQREELIQAGYIGLMHAVRHYDIHSDTMLLTYAVPWILGEMKRAVRMGDKAQQLSLDAEYGKSSLREQLTGEAGIHISYIDLHIAMQKLPDEEHFLLCLRYYRDLSQTETGTLMKKSQAQISRIERRALDHLREILA